MGIREKTIGRPVQYKTRDIEYEGEKVVFRQPSQKIRKNLVKQATKNGDFDAIDFQVRLVIALTEDDKGKKVFEDTDYDSLMDQPSGGFLELFAEECMLLLGNGQEQEEESN